MFILWQLQEQLPTAIHILEQALNVKEDMILPTAPSLSSEPVKKEQPGQEKTASDSGPTDDNTEQIMDVDGTDEDKVECKSGIKNGSDECNNGTSTDKKMEICAEEVFKVKKDDIIAQVCWTCTCTLQMGNGHYENIALVDFNQILWVSQSVILSGYLLLRVSIFYKAILESWLFFWQS